MVIDQPLWKRVLRYAFRLSVTQACASRMRSIPDKNSVLLAPHHDAGMQYDKPCHLSSTSNLAADLAMYYLVSYLPLYGIVRRLHTLVYSSGHFNPIT